MPYFIILCIKRTVGSQDFVLLISDRKVAIVMHQFLEISHRVLLLLTGTLMCGWEISWFYVLCAETCTNTEIWERDVTLLV